MSDIVFHNKKDVEEFVCYGGACAIHGSVNHKLREEVKTWKREFTPEFKAWYINMMGTCNHRLLLDCDKNKNEWWFNTDDAFKLHICNEISRNHYHYIKKDR